ncbi:hypothetical protein R3W88_021340 [Solanum pinnatisectum]|uniref:EF-hand domain-containing protein n=1 Tax=Solanum pinnatisectum TaxID=50273 RepID=A0AAV9LVG6_9SOLN|nr:hypothetical protein R3W88_021340 [Solanum pinnatisectum]
MVVYTTKNLKKPQSKEEIKCTPKNLQNLEYEENVKRLLKKCDKNGDGRLSMKQLIEVFSWWFSCFNAERLKHADINHAGYIFDDEIHELVKYATKYGYKIVSIIKYGLSVRTLKTFGKWYLFVEEFDLPYVI